MSKFYQDFPCLAKCCLAFFGGDAKSLAWVFLARRVLPFVFVFFCVFWGAMPNPSLGCFLLVGCCLSCLGSFVAFFGGDAKSLAWVFLARRVLPFVFVFLRFLGGDAKSIAWVFLARRVLPFVLGFFCSLFWGRCQIPRLGVSCSSGAAFRVWVLFLPFLGAAKSLAWVFLARRVLSRWMVMGSVYLELFETKPCCIRVCPIIPYVLWNTIL